MYHCISDHKHEHCVLPITAQVIYGCFLLLCPIGEAISQTVQAYLPAYLEKTPKAPSRLRQKLTKNKAVSTRSRFTLNGPAVQFIKAFSGVAVVLGLIDAVIAWIIPVALPQLFTPDNAIWSWMSRIAPLNAAVLTTHAASMLFQVMWRVTVTC
jgi:hypothetical protein